MNSVYAFGVFLILFLGLYLFIRKDTNEDKSLTRKGWIKLGLSLLTIFILAGLSGILWNG